MVAIASTSNGHDGGGKTAPAPASDQRDRDHQSELRLVGQKAEQNAGNDRPTVELYQRSAEQSGGEETVLAVTDIDQHRREGEREQEPVTSPRVRGEYGRSRKDRADRQQIEAERYRLPDRERDRVGQQASAAATNRKNGG